MFFSISIPVYNAERYLEKCLKSIIEQSERDFEVILVDDGSKDSSLSICKAWEKRYPGIIRAIEKENTGSLLTRRRCLQESRGEYIYIMDADDYLISNDALKIIKDSIIRNKCDLVFFNCTNNGEEPYFHFPFRNEEIFENGELKRIYSYLISNRGLNPLWNKVFQRSLVDWNEDYSNYSNLTNGTDFFQSIPIVFNSRRALYIDSVLYYYRTENNSNSIVHRFKQTAYDSSMLSFSRLTKYVVSTCNNDFDQLLKNACMKSISTAAYKARLIEKNNINKRVEYLKKISDDHMLYDYFSLKGLSFGRKGIIIMLRLKLIRILAMIL